MKWRGTNTAQVSAKNVEYLLSFHMMRVFLCCRFCFSGHFEFSFYFLTPRSGGTVSNLEKEIQFWPNLNVQTIVSSASLFFQKSIPYFLKINLGYFLQKLLGWDKSHPSPSVPPGLTPKQEPEKMELSPQTSHNGF